MTLPTVLFPHPAGPVTTQICWVSDDTDGRFVCCCVAGVLVFEVTDGILARATGFTNGSTTGVFMEDGWGRSPADSMVLKSKQ